MLDILLLAANTAAFAVCWFSYCEKHLYLSFEVYGDYKLVNRTVLCFLNAGFCTFGTVVFGLKDQTHNRADLLQCDRAAHDPHFFMYMVTWMLVSISAQRDPLLLCLSQRAVAERTVICRRTG